MPEQTQEVSNVNETRLNSILKTYALFHQSLQNQQVNAAVEVQTEPTEEFQAARLLQFTEEERVSLFAPDEDEATLDIFALDEVDQGTDFLYVELASGEAKGQHCPFAQMSDARLESLYLALVELNKQSPIEWKDVKHTFNKGSNHDIAAAVTLWRNFVTKLEAKGFVEVEAKAPVEAK